jgi:hypothetical protein
MTYEEIETFFERQNKELNGRDVWSAKQSEVAHRAGNSTDSLSRVSLEIVGARYRDKSG